MNQKSYVSDKHEFDSLEYTFTIFFNLGACRLLSTPFFFKTWFGIAILQVSPSLTGSTLRVSPKALKLTA